MNCPHCQNEVFLQIGVCLVKCTNCPMTPVLMYIDGELDRTVMYKIYKQNNELRNYKIIYLPKEQTICISSLHWDISPTLICSFKLTDPSSENLNKVFITALQNLAFL